MLFVDQVKPLLGTISGALADAASKSAAAAYVAWQSYKQQLASSTGAITPDNVSHLLDLVAAYRAAQSAVSDTLAFYSTVWGWALNSDDRKGLGLPIDSFPAATGDVAALATAIGVSLALPAPPPPPPLPQSAFMVPGGFIAVVEASSYWNDPATGKPCYRALPGDTVPNNMLVTTPDGRSLMRRFALLPFSGMEENWYVTQ